MIGLENYYAMRSKGLADYDEVWVIMRSAPKDMPFEFRHVSALAPSWSLFRLFRSLKESNNWNQDTFSASFVPQYIQELFESQEAADTLQELIEKARSGKTIALVCTCYYEECCHRAILGGILQGMMLGIGIRAKHDYTQYWRMFEAV